ncbi:hypothetical protein HMF8227_00825 [Saliniradius amylolyticus]|uniref:Negative regulator of flagellin synthesis n=1 Tax=Saliniradius amylolyticus TaxID=2183582 RepID=A0A2S2E237_9ALTE|nr:flagellar biosynthesis anti-sigma factor FlgM [Saliniradius amylolyticus]AWL11320.1 hypothetical protein HMF8227_00825 [Saliniradius amylolyticus]
MAINNVNNNLSKSQVDSQKLAQQQAQNQSNQAAAQKTGAKARPDSVSLTQSAQQMANVQKKSNEAPVNQDKVDKLKKAIQAGEYKVNADVLADKIAKMESELFGGEKA